MIERLDHLVLTVASINDSVRFYRDGLGMDLVHFGAGRTALAFGQHKINLHEQGAEFEPKALRPTPGSADFCLITRTPLIEVARRLESVGSAIEEGPVKRTGACGPLISVYVRDPDGTTIEFMQLPALTAG